LAIQAVIARTCWLSPLTNRQGHVSRRLVLWVDGFAGETAHGKLCSAAVGYRYPQSGEWREYVTISVLNPGSSNEAELMAIEEGLRQAHTLTDCFDQLLIFSDSQSMLSGIKNESAFAFLRERYIINGIFERAHAIYDLGIQMELHWVPGDAHVKAHERVDGCAREYRRSAASLRPRLSSECDASLKSITVIPGPLATARENLRVVLRDHLGRVKEPKATSERCYGTR
jgi:ribonuclease HI